MKAEIITIGDEILIGQTTDTNSAYMGELLYANGVKVRRITSISDTKEEIVTAIDEAFSRADLVLMTGGLGPTKDDITKYTLAEYFNCPLERNKEVEQKIREYFQNIGRDVLEVNLQQADLPKGAEVIENKLGTAQGMLFEKNGKQLLSMPGVPYEMKYIFGTSFLPRLKKQIGESKILVEHLITKGIGESFLAEIIIDWENRFRADGFSLAYLPSPGIVKLRLSKDNSTEKDKELLENYLSELKTLISEHVYADSDVSIEKAIIQKLIANKQSISLAESCTGGNVTGALIRVPRASEAVIGALVAYSNEVKNEQLSVDEILLEEYGAVSEEVVVQMAINCQKKFKTNFAISVSGVAGPTGGTEEKPVGLVHFAIATPEGIKTFKQRFNGDRERVIKRAQRYILSEFWDILQQGGR